MKLHILYNYKTRSGTTDLETASVQSRHQRMKTCNVKKEIRSYFVKTVHRKEGSNNYKTDIKEKKEQKRLETTQQHLIGSYRVLDHVSIAFVPQTLICLKRPSLRISNRKLDPERAISAVPTRQR